MRKVNIKAKRKKERMEERKRKTTTKTNFKETALPQLPVDRGFHLSRPSLELPYKKEKKGYSQISA